MNTMVLEKFKLFFSNATADSSLTLEDIYSHDVDFKDPIHEIKGIDNLKRYFEGLNRNLIEGQFLFEQEIISQNRVCLAWKVNLKLKRPFKKISTCGVSLLTIDDKIIAQRDFFDAGALFYENIPLLGGVIRLIKTRIP